MSLGEEVEDGDIVQTYGNGFRAFIKDDPPGWTPEEPALALGQAFFYKKSVTSTHSQWVRHFTVQ
jgi:hypothetical protein